MWMYVFGGLVLALGAYMYYEPIPKGDKKVQEMLDLMRNTDLKMATDLMNQEENKFE